MVSAPACEAGCATQVRLPTAEARDDVTSGAAAAGAATPIAQVNSATHSARVEMEIVKGSSR